jgi:MFS family permease
LSTFAASLVRGIDTLFLVDAGLTPTQIFSVYAFMTAGTLLFEIPTGIFADQRGRRFSYVIGTAILAISTFLYWFFWEIQAGFVLFSLSLFIFGLGYTFFSGATEAWLVDALDSISERKELELIFSQNQIIVGSSMLIGTLLGGVIAQYTNLGVPYIIRTVLFLAIIFITIIFMRDWGFTPYKNRDSIIKTSIKQFKGNYKLIKNNLNLLNVIIGGALVMCVMFYVFYALQPFLLELFEDDSAYYIAAIASAVLAGMQILGGLIGGKIRKLFRSKLTFINVFYLISIIMLASLAFINNFYLAIAILIIWSLALAIVMPARQVLINSLITDSKNRASILSVDSLGASALGVGAQPILGFIAGTFTYGISFFAAAIIQSFSIIFMMRVKED